VDLEVGVLTITRSVVEATKGQLVEKDTKTHGSRRIALDPHTAAVLADHEARCDARAEACAVERAKTAFVFSGAVDGSRPWVPNDITKRFIRVRNRVGLKDVRLHDLRHFAATRSPRASPCVP